MMATPTILHCHLFEGFELGIVDEYWPIFHRGVWHGAASSTSHQICTFSCCLPVCFCDNNTPSGGHLQQLHAANCRRLETLWVVKGVQACPAAGLMATSQTHPAGWQSWSRTLLPRASPVMDLAALTMLVKIRSAKVHAHSHHMPWNSNACQQL